METRDDNGESVAFPERATYGCTTCGSINHTAGSSWCNGTRYALVACFPGCGWNGEMPVDTLNHWRCPGCDAVREFRSHRADSGGTVSLDTETRGE